MTSMELYTQTGRAYALAGMSSRMSQRPTTRGNRRASCLSADLVASMRGVHSSVGHDASGANASSVDAPGDSCSPVGAFETPAMVRMVLKSQKRNQSGPF
ncbi:putative VWA-Hint protein, Vwaint [Rosa chinensis]|uniref:Putative VWA-Hint protein, Vwaint n=1 Tax=Rosa chinensis TaxID=74649 RepID=A0A2P6Q6W3_ROSCH|nr:putative VWA-Hint protein, Vwaint [Rosa chinensis]